MLNEMVTSMKQNYTMLSSEPEFDKEIVLDEIHLLSYVRAECLL